MSFLITDHLFDCYSGISSLNVGSSREDRLGKGRKKSKIEGNIGNFMATTGKVLIDYAQFKARRDH